MSDADEFAFIQWVRGRVAGHPRLALGIGDDTAVLRFPAPSDSLIAVDMLMEGTHFTFPPARRHGGPVPLPWFRPRS